ncbi:hypothetical protein [Mangrovimonas cancribranchiae]|uniref:Uncharacterized protein n=1 Tax=Mangrovimonas cancribranchiae TaxID=3080055 RepID=A0AAU6P4T7_9FLAO
MKKRTRNIILLITGVLVCLFFYGNRNFEKDKETLLILKSKAGNGEIKYVLDQIEDTESLSSPLINIAYQKWKNKMYERFITKEETIENVSGNKVIDDISNIYREYWRTELLKEASEIRTDSFLYHNLAEYLLSNSLTKLSKDSLQKTIKNDVELKKIIEKEGFKAKFMYRDRLQDLIIWDSESSEKYEVSLPKDTIITTVKFIQNYVLNGYDDYATFGSSQVGGWAEKESATLYCNTNEYDLNSELFKISYLKHESLHFTDLNEYPNLSSTDLEYRAKIIELMFCSEATIYDRIAQFLNGADSENRSHAHAYANYSLIKNLSKIIFKSKYVSDYNEWKPLPVEKINEAAKTLYYQSESILQNDKSLSEII